MCDDLCPSVGIYGACGALFFFFYSLTPQKKRPNSVSAGLCSPAARHSLLASGLCYPGRGLCIPRLAAKADRGLPTCNVQRAMQRQQLLCPHLARWHDRKVITVSCRWLPAARTLPVAHASSSSALGPQADTCSAAGEVAQASSIMEHAPVLASIHNGSLLGGDAEGAPPVPTLARTLALAQQAIPRPRRAHRRCNVSRLTPHPCPRLCCMAVARRRATYEQHDSGLSCSARPTRKTAWASYYDLLAACAPRYRAENQQNPI